MADESFSETTDGVKAKLTVEVPEQAMTTLSQLAKQTEAYRVSMEAAARATGDHMGYLEKMPTIADVATKKLKEWCDQVEHAVELKGKLGDVTVPGATGQDSANPFGNATLGRGDLANLLNPMAANDPGRVVSMGAARGLVNPGAVGGMSDEQIDKLARALASAVGGGDDPPNDGGGGKKKAPPGEDPKKKPKDDEGLSPRALEESALKGRDLVGKMLDEIGPGASMGDALGAGRDLLGMAGGAGGMLGKVGSALGPVGAGLGLALTANQLIQMGGQRAQDYRNLGGEAGGGMGEGMGYDAQAKMLALDPFISTAQAREVIQGALSAGHAGPSFDKVTDFLATNLKDMNMQVSDSVKLLKTNVEDGGMSIEQLSASLANLTNMAKDGARSRSELQADFGATTSALTAAGIKNQGQVAESAMGAFQGSPLLESVGSTALQGILSSPTAIGQLATMTGINEGTPGATIQAIGDSGKLPGATNELLARWVTQAKQMGGDKYRQIDNLMMLLQANGITGITRNQAAGLIDTLGKPGGAAEATKKGQDALQAGSRPIDRGTGESVTNALAETGNHAKNLIDTVGNIGKDIFTLNWGGISGDIDAQTKRKGEIDRESEANLAPYTNDILQNAVKQYGSDNLTVYDKDGGNPTALDQKNKEQRDKLASGELLIARQGGGPPQSLQSFGSAEKTQSVAVAGNLQVSYQGPITGPSQVSLTQNQQQANTGYPGSTLNKPPPGDK